MKGPLTLCVMLGCFAVNAHATGPLELTSCERATKRVADLSHSQSGEQDKRPHWEVARFLTQNFQRDEDRCDCLLRMGRADLLTAIQARDPNLCPRLAELPADSDIAVNEDD